MSIFHGYCDICGKDPTWDCSCNTASLIVDERLIAKIKYSKNSDQSKIADFLEKTAKFIKGSSHDHE